MSDLVFSGKVIAIGQPRSGTGKNGAYTINNFTIEADEWSSMTVDVFSDASKPRWNEFNINIGDMVTAYLSVRSHESNGRRWNNISAWKVEHNQGLDTGDGIMKEAVRVVAQEKKQPQNELPF